MHRVKLRIGVDRMLPGFAQNPVIYQLLIDRFSTGELSLVSCKNDQVGAQGAFWGGRFKGVTEQILSGWFTALGVNVILISAPYEQIVGWVPGGGGKFKHYAYHGYYALDYTCVDRRFGSEADLHELVECAHSKGIAVLMDIVMNHPGYLDLHTLARLGIDALQPGWQAATPTNYEGFLRLDSPDLRDWWGPDWVRSNLPGYPVGGEDDQTRLLEGLPDFKTESTEHVSLPIFLKRKRDSKAVDLPGTTVRGYLIHWLTAWVREYGIDGFRCDSAKHVEPEAWLELKQAAMYARRQWSECSQDGPFRPGDFWMMGEVFGQGVETSHYFDHGFDSLINFSFQDSIEHPQVRLDDVYQRYACHFANHPRQNFISYISSHDTHLFDRDKLVDGATALMLAPGGVLMLYGDETARPPGWVIEDDSAQAARSPMNWKAINVKVLEHWRKLGQFRARHAAIANGTHLKLADYPYTFARFNEAGDRVVAATSAYGQVTITVGIVFDDGDVLHDAYSGWEGRVKEGRVHLDGHGVVLLESVGNDDLRAGTAP
jgi:alpha-amylase